MSKIIETGSDSRTKLLSGVNQLANAKEEYTLAGFIESYNNIKNKLTNSIKN